MKKALLSILVALPFAFVQSLLIAQDDFPRTPSGKPDLSGNYDTSSLTPMNRPAALGDREYYTEEEVKEISDGAANRLAAGDKALDADRGAPEAGVNVGAYDGFWMNFGDSASAINGKYRTSIITYPENGRMPGRTPEGQKKAAMAIPFAWPEKGPAWWMEEPDVHPFDGPENLSLGTRCIYTNVASLPVMSLPYNNIKTVVQTEDYLMIYVEWQHWARIIRIGDKEHKHISHAAYDGDSIAWWEGDTLVVETINIINEAPREVADRRIVERFSRNDDGGIVYGYTVEDADYTDKYSAEVSWRLTDKKPYEFACHEGNHAVPGILAGARLQEKEYREKNGL
tara:strand:+ start:6523 stop:7545 length:1023 start_codon:yes stop_codon:yes gene_type:complete